MRSFDACLVRHRVLRLLAVTRFDEIAQTLRAATARTSLGSQLVNRSWMLLAGEIIVNDALEAERELSQAYSELQQCCSPLRSVLEGCIQRLHMAKTLVLAMEPRELRSARHA